MPNKAGSAARSDAISLAKVRHKRAAEHPDHGPRLRRHRESSDKRDTVSWAKSFPSRDRLAQNSVPADRRVVITSAGRHAIGGHRKRPLPSGQWKAIRSLVTCRAVKYVEARRIASRPRLRHARRRDAVAEIERQPGHRRAHGCGRGELDGRDTATDPVNLVNSSQQVGSQVDVVFDGFGDNAFP
jgi:hypothetical protein